MEAKRRGSQEAARGSATGGEFQPVQLEAVMEEPIGKSKIWDYVVKPAPGSAAALALGCECPVLDNDHGKGLGGGRYWISGGCKIHGVNRS
jgi:hypothetical protein